MLADLLLDPSPLGDVVVGPVLHEAADLLEEAAITASRQGAWTGDDPLRLSKAPVAWLLRCPRRAVARHDVDADGTDRRSLSIGRIVDAGAKLATLTSRAEPVGVDDALAFLAASGDLSVADYLDEIGADRAGELRTEAGERLDRLTAAWPSIDPAWWPRVEEPVRLRLAGGAVTLGGRLDLLLGGPPTGRPGVVIEVKSGRWHDTARADAHFYGLLLGLRDGAAPAAVVTVAAGDGPAQPRSTAGVTTQVEPIRAPVLHHTAERVAVALSTAAGLAAGEPPAAYPGSHCAHCPLRVSCPQAQAAA